MAHIIHGTRRASEMDRAHSPSGMETSVLNIKMLKKEALLFHLLPLKIHPRLPRPFRGQLKLLPWRVFRWPHRLDGLQYNTRKRTVRINTAGHRGKGKGKGGRMCGVDCVRGPGRNKQGKQTKRKYSHCLFHKDQTLLNAQI